NREVSEHVQKHWEVTVRDGFVQTETTALIGNTPGSPVKPGSMVRPLPGVAGEMVNPASGRPASQGEISLRVNPRAFYLMARYLAGDYGNVMLSGPGSYLTGAVPVPDT